MDNNDPTHPQPPKFSRYRSVRARAATLTESKAPPLPTPPPVLQPTEKSAQIKRAPSRYRRPHESRANIDALPPLPTAVPSKASEHATKPTVTLTYRNRNGQPGGNPPRHDHHDPARPTRAAPTNVQALSQDANRKEGRTDRSASAPSRPTTAADAQNIAREEARLMLEGEFERLHKLKQHQKQQNQTLPPGCEAPTMRKRRDTNGDADAKRKVEEPPEQAKQSQSPQAANAQLGLDSKSPRRIRKMMIDGSGHKPSQQTRPVTPPTKPADPASLSPKPVLAQPVEPVSLTVRAFDAPVSAVNAGDRRVEVKCGQATITLPVTPSTTVKDLLNSASVVMSQDIDPKTAIMLESFSQLGLERPLRRYEHIRDVLNSWDHDSQNHLFILSASECEAVGLDQREVPKYKPSATTVQMYHSLRPEKWDKRWLMLHDDGHVTMSKHESHAASTNICHLSDFDLYTPIRKQTKVLKPPKKICFGAKSQQKSAMFLDGANFVHFFCSGDKDIADQWYRAIHSWRSWYLANVMGEGKKTEQPRKSIDHHRRPSTAHSHETVPYQLGSFRPLLDFSELKLSTDDSAKGLETACRGSTDIQPSRTRLAPRGLVPQSAFPRRIHLGSVDLSRTSEEDGQAFTGKGLLARSASKKSQGCHISGRGATGAPGKPLVDLTAESEFVGGSLLQKLEAWNLRNGQGEPKVDREKRVEGNVTIGEGI